MFKNRFGVQWMFEADGAGGGSGGNEGGGEGESKELRNLQSLLAKKNGDAVALAAQLLGETAELREKNRNLKANQIPQGAVILTGDDAQKWNAFNELGDIAEVKRQIADASNAIAERDNLKAEKVINQAGALLGYKADVLADLAKSKGFSIEIEGEGEAAKVNARYKDGEAEAVKPMNEYAESSLSAYLPALQAQTAPMTPAVPVVPFPRMAPVGGGKQGAVNLAEAHINKAYAQPTNTQ